MKPGTENRNKTVAAGVLGACALIGVIYMATQFLGSDAPTPPPSVVPVARTTPLAGAISQNNAAVSEPGSTTPSRGSSAKPAASPGGLAAGVSAQKVASTSASLDPTLDQSAMLRAEHLVYSGSGRNIFSATYTPLPPVATVVAPKFSARPQPPVYTPPPAPPTCPPTCPPINLRFFGTATRANGSRQAFLLQGDEVFLASPGDIVARKYRIVSIAPNSLQVEDLVNRNTQTLPLQAN